MRDAKGRFCKASTQSVSGLTVTIGPEWNRYRKNGVDKSLATGHMGTIVGDADKYGRVYVSWDGMKQGTRDLDFYVLGREVVITERWKPAAKPEPTKPKNPLAGGKPHTYAFEAEPNPKVLDIAPGAVVRLKSGGPDMTVREDHETDKSCVWCHWFDGPRLNVNMLAKVCLEVVR